MPKSFAVAIMLAAWISGLPLMRAEPLPPAQSAAAKTQSSPPSQRSPVDPEELAVHIDGWNRPVPTPPPGQKSGPALLRDLSGTWEPAAGWRNGVQPQGAFNYQLGGKNLVPFTPFGERVWKTHKYNNGPGSYPLSEVNDPFAMCDPIGFPRVELQNLRSLEFLQTPQKVVIVYENDQVWRTIWIDGRDFPKIAEPRWYGYSIGKWADDTTLIAETIGLDERTWLDNAGRPHTKDLRVEERFHRVDHDILELTVTIIDPQLYTQPWNALDKYRLRLQSDDFDIRETICSESEAAEYAKEVAEEDAAAKPAAAKPAKGATQK